MPSQVRPKGIPMKIAFSLLGIPANMLYKKTAAQKKRDEALSLRQNTSATKIF